MESLHNLQIAHWNHEPALIRISQLQISDFQRRFMESPLFLLDLLTGHEPWQPTSS
jgi:hypothetical protein